MEPSPSPLSSRAKARDLRFYGPFVEMFSSQERTEKFKEANTLYNPPMPLSPRPSRREFLRGMLATPLAAAYSSFAFALPPMKITRVETVYWKSRDDAPFWPHWTWLKIDTDAGVSGIGETYPRNPVEAAMVHNVAPTLIGRDPRDIERIWADLYRTFDFQIAGGTEMRVLSEIGRASCRERV